MAQIQQQQLTQAEQQCAPTLEDDLWTRPPPDGPHPIDKPNAMDINSVLSPPKPRERTAQDFSMEDLEVARALTGLRQSSPPDKNAACAAQNTLPTPISPSQPEPLLALLTSQHPFLGSAINNSLSAYNTSKSYSSPFRYGAEFVERNIASPVASTVGTAGRISGVENGVRRWLERARSPPQSSSMVISSPLTTGNHKRRREEANVDPEQGLPAQRSRAASDVSMLQGEYLPAYDPDRSPSYSSRDPHPQEPKGNSSRYSGTQSQQTGNNNWQTRLILSTSGLGVAMSHDSRRSLKYCLSWLRWANGRLGRLLFSLQSLLGEYEAAQGRSDSGSHNQQNQAHPDHYSMPPQQPRDTVTITKQIAALKTECVKTLQSAMDIVSKHAGGSLPENARSLVRRHLISLPQRFVFMASLQEQEEAHQKRAADEERRNGSGETEKELGINETVAQASQEDQVVNEHNERETVVRGARRVVVLAREGLDMMSQVSAVVDSTIISAEEWCEKLGRKQADGDQLLYNHDAAARMEDASEARYLSMPEERSSPAAAN